MLYYFILWLEMKIKRNENDIIIIKGKRNNAIQHNNFAIPYTIYYIISLINEILFTDWST